MRKKFVSILAAALAVILLCSTALAIANYYSVRDYVADGQGSAAFEKNIMTMEQTKESNGLTFTLGDVVFDGNRFAAAMNVEAAAGMTDSLYVYPQLEAWQGDTRLDVDFMGVNDREFVGFLYPGMDAERPMDNLWGFDATLYEEAEGEIEWKIRLLLCKVNWPVEEIAWNGESFEEREDILREDFLNGTIRAFYGHDLSQYQSAICNSDPEWMEIRLDYDGPFADLMLEAGAFTEVDTVVFDIGTQAPEQVQLSQGQVFSFDEYDVEVTSLTSSFMQVDYELEVRFHEKQESEHDLELSFAPLDQNGAEMKWREGGWALSEDGMTARVHGSWERITDEELTSVTFRLNEKLTMEDYYKKNADRLTFTVEVVP